MHEPTFAIEKAAKMRSQLPVPALVAREEESTPALNLHLVRNLRLYRVPAAIAGVLVALVLVGLALSMPHTYSADAVLYVEPIKPSVTQAESGAMVDPAKYLALIEQLTQTIKRPDVILHAVHTMPEDVWQEFGSTPEAAAAAINAGLKVTRQTTSFQVDITLAGKSDTAAPQALNALLRIFLVEQQRLEASDWDARIQLLSKEYEHTSADLTEAQSRLANLTAKLGAAGFTMTSAKTLESGELEELRAQMEDVDKQRNETLGELATGGVLKSPDADVSPSHSILAQREATLREQMVGMTPANPLYKRNADELASLAKQEDDANARLRKQRNDALLAQIRQTDALSNSLRRKMDGQRARLAAAAPMLEQMADISNRVETLTAAARSLELGLRVAKLERDSPSSVKVMAYAPERAEAQKTARSLFLMLAVPMGLFVAVLTALLMSMVRRNVYSSSDVLAAAGIAPMAIIPAEGEVSEAVRDDSFVRIASSIESFFCRNNAQAFVFTPVGCTNNARSTMQAVRQHLVELGYNPLMMRAEDLIQGRQRVQALELAHAQGDGSHFNETVSGAQLRWMRSKHDMVFIEAQPLRMAAASEYAVRAADAVLLVCESSTTLKDELTDAISLLERLEVSTVGVLLDNVVLANADSVERRHLKAAHRAVATSEIRYQKSSEFSVVPQRAKA